MLNAIHRICMLRSNVLASFSNRWAVWNGWRTWSFTYPRLRAFGIWEECIEIRDRALECCLMARRLPIAVLLSRLQALLFCKSVFRRHGGGVKVSELL